MARGAADWVDALGGGWGVLLIAWMLAALPARAGMDPHQDQDSVSTRDTVVYARPTGDIDREGSYPVDLLQLALVKSGRGFSLLASSGPIPQARAIHLLRAGEVIDVLWTVTSPEREDLLLPIRIPIDRGIYGWRLFLIRADDQKRFDAVRTLDDLAALHAGQGHDWPDLPILRAAGLEVVGGSSYGGLFGMLARGRIDYFPRAVPEVWAELQERRHLPLQVEQGLALHYPSAMYFFVAPDNTELAQALTLGLERALADGSFKALFQRYFGAAIRRSRLTERRVFEIANPQQPELRDRSDARLWFRPAVR